MKVRISYFAAILFCIFCSSNLSSHGAIRYVKPVAGGLADGSTWTNASADLQLMISSSGTNDEVWVAAGTYYPIRRADALGTITIDDRDNAFVLKTDVKVYGGFAGIETLFSDRNFTTNVTILSGDIGIVNDSLDNCYHVVISSGTVNTATTILDGFTITRGEATGSSTSISVTGSSVFRGSGGGMYNSSSSPTVSNCSFLMNTCNNDGGGVYNGSSSAPFFKSCYFSQNRTLGYGGAMHNGSSPANIFNCSFRGNSAVFRGGALYNASSSVQVVNCILAGNVGSTGGGAIGNYLSTPVILNCTISSNKAVSGQGGAFYNIGGATPVICNSLVWGNTASGVPNSIYNVGSADIPTITYSVIEGGYTGTGNINADPLFISPQPAASAPTTLGNYRLQNCSPALEHGNNTGVTGLDLDGNPRIQYGIVDMGAYEMQTINGFVITPTSGIVYVDKTKPGGDGSNWANAVKELGDALKAAKFNTNITQIWVAQGTYYPQYSADSLACTGVSPRDKSFVLVGNVQVYGGFLGTETSLNQRNFTSNVTTLSGDIGVANDAIDNCYHVAIIAGNLSVSSLDGFTITKGQANIISGSTVNGISILRYNGGAIHITSSSLNLKNCNFTSNRSINDGGTIWNLNSSLNVSNCNFLSNKTSNSGGGMYSKNSSLFISNCYFSGDSANAGAGMMNIDLSSSTVIGCTFSGNMTSNGGAGIFSVNSDIDIINCTISGNRTLSNPGAGVVVTNSPNLSIKNSIIWGNRYSTSPDAIYITGTMPTISYSLIEGGYAGTGNINADPLFISPQPAANAPTIIGDYRLQNCSPAIDRGDSSQLPAGITVDLDSNDRVKFLNVDMGAYERQINTAIQIIPNAAGIVFVDSSKAVSGLGSSWATAVKELADVLKAAKYDTTIKEIWVSKGSYYPMYDAASLVCSPTNSRNQSFVLVYNVKLYGGFAGTETVLTQRNYLTNTTIMSGDIGIANDSTDNCFHVVISSGDVGTASLDGFTVTKGNAGALNIVLVNGYAISNEKGAGMINSYSSPIIKNCSFIKNRAVTIGAGIFNNFASPSILYSNFFENRSANGGGLASDDFTSAPTISNCVFSSNRTTYNGAAICDHAGKAKIINSIFSGNQATNGAGLHSLGSSAVNNCTFSGNYTTSNGSAVYSTGTSKPKISNSIFYGNSTTGSVIIGTGTADPVVTYSTVEGGYTGVGNIDANPSFVNPQPATNAPTILGDYHLQTCSPAINRGNNDSIPSGITTDLDNNPRIAFSIVDMGAYEVQSSTVFNITPTAGRIYVDKTKPGGDGSSWANAVKELADALKAAKYKPAITEIWVAQGTYLPLYEPTELGCAVSTNRDKSFVLVNNVKVYGGFAGTEVLFTDRNYTSNVTTLDGNIGLATSLDNAYHVVVSAGPVGTAALDGFSIINGRADGTGTLDINGIPVNRDYGAGMINFSSSPIIENCIFSANKGATNGGGIANVSPVSVPVITNCQFLSNTAIDGAGMCNFFSSSTINRCIFSGNSASGSGGGLYNNFSNVSIVNSLFSGNLAVSGAGMSNGSSSPSITNSSITGNQASSNGGGINNYSSNPAIKNSVIWGNTAAAVANAINNNSSTPTVNYSLVEGGYAGTGNLSSNPGFIAPQLASAAPTIGGDYRLKPCSPLVNTGNNTGISNPDLEGNPRIVYSIADMGAYEVQSSSVFTITPASGIIYVNKLSPGGIGNSWANAVTELADALKAAKYNGAVQQIWVAQGTYYPAYEAAELGCATPTNRDKSFVLVNNVKLYGGFNGTETALSERNYFTNVTTLSGDIGIANNVSDNSYHVVLGAAAVTTSTTGLDGFTITKGNANGNGNITVNGRNIFRYNGGGMYNSFSSPSLTNCTVSGNNATTNGGGVYNDASSIPFLNCIFSGNSAASGGGIMHSANTLSLTNCLLSGNTATNGGAAYTAATNAPAFINCTIASNKATTSGGGIYHGSVMAPPVIRNCIIWNNTAASAPAIYTTIGSPTVTNTLVQGGFAGVGNLNTDPLFINPQLASAAPTTAGNYRIQPCSPAINVGNNTYVPAAVTIDLDANTRIAYTTVDMGSYEVQFYDPTVNTWKGVNTVWTDVQNWCGGTVPTSTTNVTIPTGLANYPNISTTAAVKNILLGNNTSVTLTTTGSLTINGTYTNNGSTIANNGSWIMAGNATSQNFPGALATITAMNNLQINNASGVTINKSFGITGTLTATAGAINLNNVNITLKSDVNGTANIAPIQSAASFTYTGTGNFIVERFIATANSTVYPNHKKTWQFLAVPVTDVSPQTVNSAWQEGNAPGVPGTAGLGTIITNSVTGTGGFDIVGGSGPSMKTYVPNTGSGTWAGISGTNIPHYNKKGYMIFIRGDRYVTAYNANATPTTLRTRGKIFQPTINPPPSTTIGANQFESLGNPYVSAIDFSNVAGVIRTGNVQNVFYVWDPRLGSTLGYGAYQVFTKNVLDANYTVSPGGGSYLPAGSTCNRVESGQAIFVRAGSGGGTLTFNESAKVNGSVLVAKPFAANRERQIRTQLYSIDSSGNKELLDGVLNQFHENYSNEVDMLDALKIQNTSEGLGISQHGELLSVERRGVIRVFDTIYLNLNQVRLQSYQFEIIPQYMNSPGIRAWLVDKYLDLHIPISLTDTTHVNFTIENVAGSYEPGRFMLVFTLKRLIDFSPTLEGRLYDNAVILDWQQITPAKTGTFNVQRSPDAIHFTTIHKEDTESSGPYRWHDNNPLSGVGYYRIAYEDMVTKNLYSNQVKILNEKGTSLSIIVSPNPVTGKMMHLFFHAASRGIYLLTLYNSAGQIMLKQSVSYDGINKQQPVKLPYVAKGLYKLEISGPAKSSGNALLIQELLIE